MPRQCRTCGGVIYNARAKNLFDKQHSDIREQIELVSGTTLLNDPQLPSCICACCLLDLQQAITFRERCIKTQERLLLRRVKVPSDLESDSEIDDDEEVKEIKIEIESEVLSHPTEDFEEPVYGIDDMFVEETEADENEDETTIDGEDCDSLITSLQKELCSIYEDSSNESVEEFQEITDSNLSQSIKKITNKMRLTDSVAQSKRSTRKNSGDSTNPTKSTTRSISGRISHRVKKQYTTWKNLTEDEIVERKREMRRRDCVCDQCGRHFNDQSNFKLHLLRHTGIKDFKCNECSREFYTEHLLTLHIRIVHKGEKPYKCKYCSRTFHNGQSRVIHERSHTNLRPYVCPHCKKCFSSASGLQRHNLIHTGLRAFHCETCNHTFQRSTHLKAHYRSKMHKLKLDSFTNEEHIE